ncbi:hypothetical protein [Formosa sp. S-31]|uniref:hypothetical protein n=1 Tax=Formosa sp. S-31 TaxID=2790949 RepID=UPI003EB7DCDB
MKKFVLIALGLCLFNCSSDNDTDTPETSDNTSIRLKTITDSYGKVTTLYYNNANILIESEEVDEGLSTKKKYIYKDDKLVGQDNYINNEDIVNESLYYTYSDDLITESSGYQNGILYTHIYKYNNLNQLISDTQYNDDKFCCESNYTYNTNGNVEALIRNGNTTTYQYDDQKNPYHYIYNSAILKIHTVTKNNITSTSSGAEYSYKYNNEGYPIEINRPTGETIKIMEYETYKLK